MTENELWRGAGLWLDFRSISDGDRAKVEQRLEEMCARHSLTTSLKGSPRARRSLPVQRSWAGLLAAVERLLKQIRDASDEANLDTCQFSPQGLFEAVAAAEYRRKANTAKK